MYHFVPQKIVKTEDLWCRNVLLDVQSAVRDYFTFDIRLIGSVTDVWLHKTKKNHLILTII